MTWPATAPNIPVVANSETLNTAGGAASNGMVTLLNTIRTEILGFGTTLGITGGHKFPVKLAESVLVATAASISFTGIPPGYRSLWIEYLLRTNAGSDSFTFLRFNGDSGAGQYLYEDLESSGAAASFAVSSSQGIFLGTIARTADTANVFTAGWARVYAYSDTNKFKAVLGQSSRTVAAMALTSGYWRSTAGINRVDLVPSVGSYIAGSSVTLWGMPT